MEFRRVFDTIPEQFDKMRPRYTPEAFRDIIEYSALAPGRSALEIGPGTGQATEPILKSGCDYTGIELGEHLYAFTKNKFGDYPNFKIVNDDFVTHDFGEKKFDLIYSAATIQWIDEEIAFPKTYELLNRGGTLAMMLIRGEYRSANERLFQKIQAIYNEHFHPEIKYDRKFNYKNAVNYGYVDFECHEYKSRRVFDAEGYVAMSQTHCDHIVLREPYRTKFFDGLRNAVLEEGNKIVFNDTVVLYLARKSS